MSGIPDPRHNREMSGRGQLRQFDCPSHFRFAPDNGGKADIEALRICAQHQTLTRLLLEPNLSDLFAKMFHPYLSAIVSVVVEASDAFACRMLCWIFYCFLALKVSRIWRQMGHP
jgi:hypothetical protein